MAIYVPIVMYGLRLLYHCFTRTTLFTNLYDQSERLLSVHQISLLHTFWFLRELNVLPEAVYCWFTTTSYLLQCLLW